MRRNKPRVRYQFINKFLTKDARSVCDFHVLQRFAIFLRTRRFSTKFLSKCKENKYTSYRFIMRAYFVYMQKKYTSQTSTENFPLFYI